MKQKYSLLFFIAFLFVSGNSGFAQMLGSNIYLPGHYLEIGINNLGAFGTCYTSAANPAPTGYYPDAGGGTASARALASVYDYGHDGWTTGTPAYFGDYTLPGDPYEGWGIQINGATGLNWAFTENGAITGPGTLVGNNVSYTNSGGIITALWQGTAGIGGVLSINMTTTLDTNASWVVVTVVLKNTSATAIPNIYYIRTCDPDDDQTLSTSYDTYNTVTYQNDADHRVLVSSTGLTYTNAYMGLGTKDCRAKAVAYEDWTEGLDDYVTNLATVYAGTAAIDATYTQGSTQSGDYAIGLVYNLGTIGAHDSTVISYAYIYNGAEGLDSAFPDPQMAVNNAVVDSVDSFNTCSYPTLSFLPVNILNANTGVWTYSQWTWSPATGLATTTGVNNTINLAALTVPVTYTITGTDSLTGVTNGCARRVFILTVLPCFTASSNSPVCQGDTLDLYSHGDSIGATYVWYHLGTIISTAKNPVIPNVTLADSGLYTAVRTVAGESDTATTDVIINPLPVVTVISNAPLCSGGTLNLTASVDSADETFSWTGPDGFAAAGSTASITPVVVINSGLYKVYTTLNGCIDSAAINVTVDSTPAVPVISSNDTICADSTLLLFASDATPGVQYSWAGPGGFSSTLQNPIIPNATIIPESGTYTVTAILGVCRDSSTLFVPIKPTPPTPITGAELICSGDSITLTASGDTIGATYSWTGPLNFTSSLQNPVIDSASTAATGNYTVVATLNGCPSQWAQETVKVDSTPAPVVADSAITLCQYSTLYLTASTATSGVTYLWTSTTGYTSTLQNPVIPDVGFGTTGQYSVQAVSGICKSSARTLVQVDSIPLNTFLSTNAPVCSQTQLQLLSTFTPLGGTITWTGPNGFTSSSVNGNTIIPDVSTAAQGFYNVKDSLGICSSIIYTLYVAIDSTPQAPTVSSNTPVCQGDTLNLMASDATPGVSYSWTGPNGFSSTQQDPSILDLPPAAEGTYTLTAILGMCDSTAVTIVHVTLRPTFTPTSNSPVCTGDTLFLYANGNDSATFSWSGPYSYFPSSMPSPDPVILNVTTENAGVYTVTAMLNNCPKTEYDTVVINQTPPLPFISWLTYCQYYPAPPLQANDTGITWYPADTAANPYLTAPIPVTSVVGSTYYFAAQTVNGCPSGIDSILVTVYPTPTVTITPADTAVCPHSSFVLTAIDTDAITYYHWYPDIYLGDTNTAIVTVTPETDVVYTVLATNKYGCSDTATANVVVYPAALITLGDSVTLYSGQSYTITPVTNCTSFSWFPPAGLSNSMIADPVANPAVSTQYIVYGQTENGCTTSDSISIYLTTLSQIHVPNAFSPGSGPNSEFKVINDGIITLNYLRIFNRWGQKVFETSNINNGWDGTFNGTPQPFDVYIYEIQGVSGSGQTIQLQGNFTLLR